jgi:hypothetical protein
VNYCVEARVWERVCHPRVGKFSSGQECPGECNGSIRKCLSLSACMNVMLSPSQSQTTAHPPLFLQSRWPARANGCCHAPSLPFPICQTYGDRSLCLLVARGGSTSHATPHHVVISLLRASAPTKLCESQTLSLSLSLDATSCSIVWI